MVTDAPAEESSDTEPCSAAIRSRIPVSPSDDAGAGVLLYVMNPGRMKLGAAFDRNVMKSGARDPVAYLPNAASEALRDFGLGAQVLADLGLRKIRLMIHSDRKIAAIEGFGIEVVERVPIPGRSAGRRREAQ